MVWKHIISPFVFILMGEQSQVISDDVCAGMEFIGIELGPRINLGNGWYQLSKPTSQARVRVLVILSDEELMITRDTYQIVGGGWRIDP